MLLSSLTHLCVAWPQRVNIHFEQGLFRPVPSQQYSPICLCFIQTPHYCFQCCFLAQQIPITSLISSEHISGSYHMVNAVYPIKYVHGSVDICLACLSLVPVNVCSLLSIFLSLVSLTPRYRPLTRYVNLRVAHAPGMPGTFSTRPRVSDPDMHHGTCVTHVPWCMPGWLTCGFL